MSEFKKLDFGEARTFAKFLGALAGLLLTLTIFVMLANWIVADKTWPFDDQVRRVHSEFLDGRFDDVKNTKVFVLGDSTAARALIPPSMTGEKAFSLVVNGGSAVEAYYVLRRVYELGAKPACVVFMTSYGAYEYHLREKLWQTTIPQYLIRPSDITEYFETTSKLNQPPGADVFLPWTELKIRSAPILRFLDWSTLHRAIFKPYEVFIHSRRSYRLTRIGKGSNPLIAGSIWGGPEFDGPLQTYLRGPFQKNEVLDRYTNDLMKLAAAHNSTVLVLMAPTAATLRNPMSEAWVADAENHMSSMLKSHPNVIDHFRTRWMDPTDFSDGTHLVDTAGRLYSESLRADVSECVKRSAVP